MYEIMSKMSNKNYPPAKTAKQREDQLINLAINLAEKQLKEGTASSQVITHFLKLGTEKEKLENEKLKSDLRVAEAKIESLRMQRDTESIYQEAINAMKRYGGNEEKDDGDLYDQEL